MRHQTFKIDAYATDLSLQAFGLEYAARSLKLDRLEVKIFQRRRRTVLELYNASDSPGFFTADLTELKILEWKPKGQRRLRRARQFGMILPSLRTDVRYFLTAQPIGETGSALYIMGLDVDCDKAQDYRKAPTEEQILTEEGGWLCRIPVVTFRAVRPPASRSLL